MADIAQSGGPRRRILVVAEPGSLRPQAAPPTGHDVDGYMFVGPQATGALLVPKRSELVVELQGDVAERLVS
jgi:hypothetical protein